MYEGPPTSRPHLLELEQRRGIGPTEQLGCEERDGTRIHDEIRFWSDYVTNAGEGYIYDDNGRGGGLACFRVTVRDRR